MPYFLVEGEGAFLRQAKAGGLLLLKKCRPKEDGKEKATRETLDGFLSFNSFYIDGIFSHGSGLYPPDRLIDSFLEVEIQLLNCTSMFFGGTALQQLLRMISKEIIDGVNDVCVFCTGGPIKES